MALIWLGLAIWCVVHLLPGVAPGLKTSLVGRLGEGPYKGLFALSIVGAIVLIVIGWWQAIPDIVYDPPEWGRHAAMLFVLIAFILFATSHGASNIKRIVRHPMLTGMIFWAAGHLLANGDTRTTALFGVLGLWAIVEIIVINRREGPREVPAKAPVSRDMRAIVGGAVVYAVFLFIHPWLFGVSPLAM